MYTNLTKTTQSYEYRHSLETLHSFWLCWHVRPRSPSAAGVIVSPAVKSFAKQMPGSWLWERDTVGSVSAGAETSCVPPNHSNWTCLWGLDECLSLKQTLNMKSEAYTNLRRKRENQTPAVLRYDVVMHHLFVLNLNYFNGRRLKMNSDRIDSNFLCKGFLTSYK